MLWRIWTRIREVYDWAERIHFWPLVWKFIKEGYGWITGGGLFMTLAAALADMSGFAILASGLAGVVAVGIIIIAWRVLHLSRPLPHASEASDGKQHDWKTVTEAIEAFCEPDLLAAKAKWTQSLEKAVLRQLDAENDIEKIVKSAKGQIAEGSNEYAKIHKKREWIAANNTIEQMASPEVRRAWDRLRDDMQKKLREGQLIAKGFKEPHTGGSAEIEIAASEWRILSVDNAESRAVRPADLQPIYSGVVIRKA